MPPAANGVLVLLLAGFEVDFVVPGPGGSLAFVEAKAAEAPQARHADNLLRLPRFPVGRRERRIVAYRGKGFPGSRVIAPGVTAMSVSEFLTDPAMF